jgi:hypothetical protein
MFTVSQLIDVLKQHDPDRIVCLSVDSEGNDYASVHSVHTGMFEDGEMWLEYLTPELIKQGYSDENVNTEGWKAVFLFP